MDFGYSNLLVEKPDHLNVGNTIIIQILEMNGIHSFNAQVLAFWNYELNNIVDVNYLIELNERMK